MKKQTAVIVAVIIALILLISGMSSGSGSSGSRPSGSSSGSGKQYDSVADYIKDQDPGLYDTINDRYNALTGK